MFDALEKGEAFSLDAQPYCASNNRNRQSLILPVRAHATVSSAAMLIRYRGKAATEGLDEFRASGYGDDEILEIILNVALNTWTDYLNNTADTDIDSRSSKPTRHT